MAADRLHRVYSLIADAVAPGVRGIDTLDVLVDLEIVAAARG